MFLTSLFFFATVQAHPIDYFEEGKLFASTQSTIPSTDVKKQLKEKLEEVKLHHQRHHIKESKLPKSNKCLINVNIASDISVSLLYVFVSFSMPDEAWITLSRDVQNVGGILVLRGLPGDSFKNLARKMHFLRQKGVHATVQIDPQLFTKFSIQSVPCFVVTDGDKFDKLNGNVSLAFALEKMEIKSAKKMRALL
jgi:conjugal transfer pilus assembly protein TrbC